MDERQVAPFDAAFNRYSNAKARLTALPETDEPALAAVDDALDELLAVTSPSIGALGAKMQVLNAEYGLDAQPRHIGAIYADVALLAVIYAEGIFKSWT